MRTPPAMTLSTPPARRDDQQGRRHHVSQEAVHAGHTVVGAVLGVGEV